MGQFASDLNGYIDMTVGTISPVVSLLDDFNISISGTWNGKLTFQRSFDNGDTWYDVKDFNNNVETTGRAVGIRTLYRMRVTCLGTGRAKVRITR